jgi:hypothetical protein
VLPPLFLSAHAVESIGPAWIWCTAPARDTPHSTRVQLLVVEQQQLLEGAVADFLLRVR